MKFLITTHLPKADDPEGIDTLMWCVSDKELFRGVRDAGGPATQDV